MALYPSPSSQEIAQVEALTGYPFPEALVSLYKIHGNGGFGPAYGFLGLRSGHSTDLGDCAIQLYQKFSNLDPEDPGWSWPQPLFPLLHAGCSIHYCVDLQTKDNPVVKFDPNGFGPGSRWQEAFEVINPSLKLWLKQINVS